MMATTASSLQSGKEELVVVNNNQTIRHQLYAYDSYFWHLPKDFEFPMGVHLDIGWKLLDLWKPSNETIDANHIRVQAPVCPFRIPKPAMLPPGACSKKFQLNWRPIVSLMEGTPDMDTLPAMDTNSISLSFSVGKEYLKTCKAQTTKKLLCLSDIIIVSYRLV